MRLSRGLTNTKDVLDHWKKMPQAWKKLEILSEENEIPCAKIREELELLVLCEA